MTVSHQSPAMQSMNILTYASEGPVRRDEEPLLPKREILFAALLSRLEDSLLQRYVLVHLLGSV